MGDLNLWNADDLNERFYSGKTRALHGTHVTTGARLWSGFPHAAAHGDDRGGQSGLVRDRPVWRSVHDVIGTRCDPYTGKLLSGTSTTIAAIRT